LILDDIAGNISSKIIGQEEVQPTMLLDDIDADIKPNSQSKQNTKAKKQDEEQPTILLDDTDELIHPKMNKKPIL